MGSGFDRNTLDFYTRNAAHYLQSRPDAPSHELVPFLERLPVGARILELGCGGGRDAAYMVEQGFDVDPTDGSEAMAAEAEKCLGKAARVMRFDALDADEDYDAVIALASLLHVPLPGLPGILHNIWRALKSGGWHLATFKTNGEEGHDDHGRYYNYLSRNEAEQLYQEAGNWADLEFLEWQGEGWFSPPARWLQIVARKR